MPFEPTMEVRERVVYLSRGESDAIKGLLIALIALGHNHILCPPAGEGTNLMEWLYMFHVAGFFILPFFYDRVWVLSRRRVADCVVKLWWPYLWVLLLCWVSMCVSRHEWSFGWSQIHAAIMGTQTPIQEAFGFIFPWFLPVFCSLQILMMLAQGRRWLRLALVLVALVLLSLPWGIHYELKTAVPFGLVLAVSYFGYGVLTFSIHRLWRYAKYIAIVIFVLLSVCYGLEIPVGGG